MSCPPHHCVRCFEQGQIVPALLSYLGQTYCKACDATWVAATRKTTRSLGALPQRLREAKKRRSARSKELAATVNVSEQAMSAYLREEAPTRPGLDTFLGLCVALNAHPNELLGFVDPRVVRLEAEAKKYREALGCMFQIFSGLGLQFGDQPERILREMALRPTNYRDQDHARAETEPLDAVGFPTNAPN